MTWDIASEKVLILDFGSQYTQLIARRVRECGVFCEICPPDISPSEFDRFNPVGIVLSGGPASASQMGAPEAPSFIFERGIPVLGICYGMQAMAVHLGGKVSGSEEREFGYAQVRIVAENRLLKDIEDHTSPNGEALLEVWMSHGDRVLQLPPGFKVIASTEAAPIAAMADEARGLYGLQFHPEVTHTRQGRRILDHFLRSICGCGGFWTPSNIIASHVEEIRSSVGNEGVLLGLSGGVDSAVAAALIHRAIGDQLTCVFVDNGLLRLNEAEQVMATFAKHMGIRVVKVEAGTRFLTALSGISDPERKRKVIGETFVEVFEKEASNIKDVKWLAQGTIYPDVIESASSQTGHAQTIKSHHNVGGLPAHMNLRLLEPLRDLFKDEVRKIGLELGLPAEMIERHPFPGPGLGVRILGEVTEEAVRLLRRADAIFIDALLEAGLYQEVSQAFAVFLPVRSVGVVGDQRCYDHVIALRAVETVDFMTARWAYLPYDFLDNVARRIINRVEGISRVVYDISGKPPATIEWE